MTTQPAGTGSAIRVQGLGKRFKDLVALDGVDFTVPPGTVFGLLGPNGAGKTTAIRILTTIIRPTAGRAEVLGTDVVAHPAAVRRLIGLAGQYAAVDPNLTARENLRLIGRLTQLPRRRRDPRAADLLARFDLTAAADRPVRTYSGGMRRRLDVAAALVPEPPVLFLDEPTTGLDPQSRTALWELIRELVAEGTTVLLTTQYLEEADRLAQRVAVLAEGRVVADDSPHALKARLGTTVLELGMGEDPRATRAAALLADRLRHAPERDGAVLRLPSADGSLLLMDVLHALEAERLAPRTIAVRESSLDDVYLALTGHRTAPPPAGPAAAASTAAETPAAEAPPAERPAPPSAGGGPSS
ncbi:ATP-binding cassette domain-containing protein [Kitasatospora cineracea]|uniref:ABC-type xenobiotic transporter n=1 Tax=Kitasatospora cineracea TaxID=88074 RepID=A0A8G1XG82_9ACTN|nr:ATP-binding cassette domain-containing protein [Kitasatospora cineracea]ROR45157.1 ABC-2 type transport system ATP-binding protein/oleandomycin transport system ATP-binding protein [Kitasatospora cineracea]